MPGLWSTDHESCHNSGTELYQALQRSQPAPPSWNICWKQRMLPGHSVESLFPSSLDSPLGDSHLHHRISILALRTKGKWGVAGSVALPATLFSASSPRTTREQEGGLECHFKIPAHCYCSSFFHSSLFIITKGEDKIASVVFTSPVQALW